METIVIGNYAVGNTIGEGTFGKVRLGINKSTRDPVKVAIKILEKTRIVEPPDVERVMREVQILQLLNHPNVVQVHEIIEENDYIYMVMQYANGGELFDYIVDSTRLKELEACKFMHQIINGVDYIHKLGVAHRDLKPENLLLQLPQKDILIVDFGLSNSFKDAGLLKTACGSPCYAAPEMIAGRFYDGEKTDIWSCGVIMYALLCGYLPFEDDNTQLLYKKILTADFHIPRFVSSDGKDLIRNILTVDPQKRFTIEQIRSHSWWKLYQQEEPAVPAQPPNVKVSMLPNSIYVAPQPQYPSIEIEHEEPTQLHQEISQLVQDDNDNQRTSSKPISLCHSRDRIQLSLSRKVLEELQQTHVRKASGFSQHQPSPNQQPIVAEIEIEPIQLEQYATAPQIDNQKSFAQESPATPVAAPLSQPILEQMNVQVPQNLVEQPPQITPPPQIFLLPVEAPAQSLPSQFSPKISVSNIKIGDPITKTGKLEAEPESPPLKKTIVRQTTKTIKTLQNRPLTSKSNLTSKPPPPPRPPKSALPPKPPVAATSKPQSGAKPKPQPTPMKQLSAKREVAIKPPTKRISSTHTKTDRSMVETSYFSTTGSIKTISQHQPSKQPMFTNNFEEKKTIERKDSEGSVDSKGSVQMSVIQRLTKRLSVSNAVTEPSAPKRQLKHSIQMQETHIGPYNMSCVTAQPYKTVLTSLEKYLKSAQIAFVDASPFELVCSQLDVRISIKKLPTTTLNILVFGFDNTEVNIQFAEGVLQNIKL